MSLFMIIEFRPPLSLKVTVLTLVNMAGVHPLNVCQKTSSGGSLELTLTTRVFPSLVFTLDVTPQGTLRFDLIITITALVSYLNTFML